MLNLALVPLKTNESERSLCLASANASSELQKDLKLIKLMQILIKNCLVDPIHNDLT